VTGIGGHDRYYKGFIECLPCSVSMPRQKSKQHKTPRQPAKKAAPAVKTRQRLQAARKGNAAKVKPAKARIKADTKAAHGALPQWMPAEIEEAFRRLSAAAPTPRTELAHVNPFTLLVAVVLSAQATDAGVNKATPALFALADTPEKMAALGEAKVRDRSTAAKSRTTATRSKRCPASAARPQMSFSTSRSASRPSRSTRTSSGSATAPGSPSARRRSMSR
jgi:hypothetical protein